MVNIIQPVSKNPVSWNTPNLAYQGAKGLFGGGGGGGMGPSGMVDETAYANQDFQDIYGRAPTAAELAQALPAYIDPANPHIPNKAGGKAFVAQMWQTQENTPDKIAQKNQEKYLAEAPQHFDAVNQVFQSNLGRTASQDELNHFGSLISSGSVDPYQLQQFLQQQPEYQTVQNQKMREGLSGTMAANDKRQFSEQILPSIQEAYAKQGRSFDSTAFSNSAANAAQAQNTGRESFLNNLTASQYGGVQDRAYQDYANMVANQQGLTNAGINAQYSGVQNTINRSNQISDFNTQSQLYNQYLARYGKRNNGMGGLLGGLAGAGIGLAASGGNPMAGGLGYTMGSSFGTGIQNAGGSY